MTITILPEGVGKDRMTYRAISGARQSEGKTAGEALDALAEQMNEEDAGTLVIVQNLRPDRFFSAQQKERLGELMTRWRTARDANDALPTEEEAELEKLIEAELNAAGDRALGLSREFKRDIQAGESDQREAAEGTQMAAETARQQFDRLQEEHQQVQAAALQLLEINRLKSEFIVNAGREIEASLQTVLNLAESLERGSRGNLTSEQLEAVHSIYAWARRIKSDVDWLVEYGSARSRGLESSGS